MISLRAIVGWLGFGGLVVVELARSASAQVFQQGGITPQHMTMWSTNNTVMDAGGAALKPQGLQPHEIGIVALPNKTGNPFPATASGTGPNGENICDYDSPLGTPGHYICLSPNIGGGVAALNMGSIGGAAPASFQITINGTAYSFPGAGNGNVSGPTSPFPTAGNFALWNGGTNLKDAATSPLHSIGGNVAPITADGAQLTIQNSATTAPNIQGSSGYMLGVPPTYDVVRSVVNVPSGSTLSNSEAFGAYVISNAAGGSNGNGVGYYAISTAGANGANVWGANYILADGPAGPTTGVTGAIEVGIEIDFSTRSTTTTVEGIGLEGNFNVQPTNANAFQIAAGANSTTGKWINGFVASPGCCSQAAFIVGGLAAAPAHSQPSQNLVFQSTDATGAGVGWQLATDGGGNFDIIPTSPAGTHSIGLNGSVNITPFSPSVTGIFQMGGMTVLEYNTTSHILNSGNDPGIASVILGNGTATLTLGIGNSTGAASKYVCVDSSGVVVVQTAAC
jgi:hypothetical protein